MTEDGQMKSVKFEHHEHGIEFLDRRVGGMNLKSISNEKKEM
jgi:hypothetical protein